MFQRIHRSLLLRLALALALVAGVAFFAILSSVLIAEQLRGAATAINHAGTLRYSSYYASTTALRPQGYDVEQQRKHLESAVARFEQHYSGDALLRAVPSRASHPARQAHEDVGQAWQNSVRPLILGSVDREVNPGFYAELRTLVDDFVRRVDAMVVLLEQRIEGKVQLLQLLQAVAFLIALVVAFFTVYVLRRDVMPPLRALMKAASAVRRGDFSHRIAYTKDNELGQIGSVFNRMTRDLAQLYGDLEQRVHENTRALELSNQSLELMYRSLMHLDGRSDGQSRYVETLHELESMLALRRGSLTLLERDYRTGGTLPQMGKIPGCPMNLCEVYSSCTECIGALGEGLRQFTREDGSPVLAVPLFDGMEVHGLLRVELPGGASLEPWQTQLVEAVGRHLAMSLANERRALQGQRMVLLEERATIARELHDSLAQSLSYLKIELSLLRSALRTPARLDTVEATVESLQEGLDDAYSHLRTLLKTFRIGHQGDAFSVMLAKVVADASKRGVLDIQLENALADGELSINEEVHSLQIACEALCNVVKHARASRAHVSFRWAKDGGVCLSIRDNGVGMDGSARNRPERYGLTTMLERARHLQGHLHIGPVVEGGTEVRLLFQPTRGPLEAEHSMAAEQEF